MKGLTHFGGLAGLGLALLQLSGCGTAPPRAPEADLGGSSSGLPATPLSPGLAEDITLYAIGLVGTPYRFGGNTPQTGFDCSGLIGHVYRTRAGLQPPRSVAQIGHWGQPVSSEQLRAGDLVLFAQGGNPADHAGIYVGAGRFVHAPSSGGVVRLDALNGRYWATRQVAFRRP